MLIASIVFIIIGVAVIVWAVAERLRRPEPAGFAGGLAHTRPSNVRRRDDFVDLSDDVVVESYLVEPTGAAIAGAFEDPQLTEVPQAAETSHPTWPERVQKNAGALDSEARLKIIADLGLLRAAWCVPILEQAIEEETDQEVRVAAVGALAKCRRPARAGAAAPSTNGAPPELTPSE